MTNYGPELLNQYIDEGRIIRHEWYSTDTHGRETACLYYALTGSKDTDSCPSNLMPIWLAELTPLLDDKGSDKAWLPMVKRFGTLATKWHALDTSAWCRCEARTMIAALEIAQPHDTANVVAPVIQLWQRVLAGDEPASAEWASAHEAARAAWASAWTAWTAWAAVEAAAREAAWASAQASAAAAAREAAWAWAAAREAAWDKITDACLSAIEAELN